MILDLNTKYECRYCVETWQRDAHIAQNIAKVKGRIQPQYDLRVEPCAVVCFGPSLADTWEKVREFKWIISCSGSHKFLLERGIVPNFHVEVDPRIHKIELLGPPHKDVEYLIASPCHPKYFEQLVDGGFNVKLWHVFDTQDEGIRVLPPGEWALTGGSSVGHRALTIARFLGFTDLHIFGMDGNRGPDGTMHAAAHPNQPPSFPLEVDGRTWYTTPAMLETAKGTFHELNMLKDVRATFYGDGLVQSLAKTYVPAHPKEQVQIAFVKDALISAPYVALNAQMHKDHPAYGVGGFRHADTVIKMAERCNARSVLDYGCGKGELAKAMPYGICEYDPAIPGKEASPRPADLVVCTDVLEHVEPDKLIYVLSDLRRVVKKVGYLVIDLGPSTKTLSDGRNSHLIQECRSWWEKRLRKFFTVPKGGIMERDQRLYIVVGPKQQKGKSNGKAAQKTGVVQGDPVAVGG